MPTYEYRNEKLLVGVDAYFPIGEVPDEIVLRRVAVPSRITVGVGAKPPTPGDRLMAGWKNHEKHNGSYQPKPGDLSADEIRAVCARREPEPTTINEGD